MIDCRPKKETVSLESRPSHDEINNLSKSICQDSAELKMLREFVESGGLADLSLDYKDRYTVEDCQKVLESVNALKENDFSVEKFLQSGDFYRMEKRKSKEGYDEYLVDSQILLLPDDLRNQVIQKIVQTIAKDRGLSCEGKDYSLSLTDTEGNSQLFSSFNADNFNADKLKRKGSNGGFFAEQSMFGPATYIFSYDGSYSMKSHKKGEYKLVMFNSKQTEPDELPDPAYGHYKLKPDATLSEAITASINFDGTRDIVERFEKGLEKILGVQFYDRISEAAGTNLAVQYVSVMNFTNFERMLKQLLFPNTDDLETFSNLISLMTDFGDYQFTKLFNDESRLTEEEKTELKMRKIKIAQQAKQLAQKCAPKVIPAYENL